MFSLEGGSRRFAYRAYCYSALLGMSVYDTVVVFRVGARKTTSSFGRWQGLVALHLDYPGEVLCKRTKPNLNSSFACLRQSTPVRRFRCTALWYGLPRCLCLCLHSLSGKLSIALGNQPSPAQPMGNHWMTPGGLSSLADAITVSVSWSQLSRRTF